MPKTYTPDGNYAQNIEYKATARRAREEKEMARAKPAKKRRKKPPVSPPGKSKWHRLAASDLPRRGQRYASDAAQQARLANARSQESS